MPRPVETVAAFIHALETSVPVRGKVRLFRGHDIAGLKPEPKILRSNNIRNEHKIIREFVSAFPQEFDRDATTLEKLVRAQHFSVPTRLLDLSWNPLVALYFACNAMPKQDGEVLSYTVPKTRIKYYDSDTVSIISNLSYLTPDQKDKILAVTDDEIILNDDDIKKYNSEKSMRYLLHYIRGEKPHFQAIIDPDSLTDMFFVKPKLNNRRILAQSGAFAIYGLRTQPYNPRRYSLERYIIPADSKKPILDTLELLNIHNSSLFPEVENAASYIQSRM